MKILVTGGAGFIGSHITDKLVEKGHEVSVLDNLSSGKKENINPKANFFHNDINDKEIFDIFEQEKFDAVYHQAAQMNVRFSVDNPQIDASTNIIGSINLLEASRLHGVQKFIFASSGGAIYGEQNEFPAKEDHPQNPCSPYGIAKLSVEKYLFYYKEEYNIDYVAMRYANVYGPRQNSKGEAGVVAIFCERMLNDKQPVINGDGLNTRDYVYVEDVVNANIAALDNEISGAYNVGTGIETDVNEIFRTLQEYTNSGCVENHGPAKKGEQRRSVISYIKLMKETGWEPKTDLKSGLLKTVESFKKELNK